MIKRIRCWFKGIHDAHPYLGGFKCSLCHFTGVDLKEMGFDAGHVSLLRKLFERKHIEITRTYGDW